MSKFPNWFSKAYNRWKKSQPSEENFPAFCDLLGYPATKVMSWLQGETEPQGPELLNIAGVCGIEVYSVLNQPKPDPELLNIYRSFPHLSGENRSMLAHALREVQFRLDDEKLSPISDKAKEIFEVVFSKYGLNNPM